MDPTPSISELEALLARARDLQNAGNLRGARAALDQASVGFLNYATWHYAHGALSQLLGETARAVRDFEAAVEREPQIAEFRSNLGAALLEQAKAGDAAALERATAELETAARLSPRLPTTLHNLGTARLLAHDAAAALKAFDAALKMDPRHVPSLYNRAAALNQLGRKDECRRALDATLKVAPDFAPARESRARLTK